MITGQMTFAFTSAKSNSVPDRLQCQFVSLHRPTVTCIYFRPPRMTSPALPSRPAPDDLLRKPSVFKTEPLRNFRLGKTDWLRNRHAAKTDLLRNCRKQGSRRSPLAAAIFLRIRFCLQTTYCFKLVSQTGDGSRRPCAYFFMIIFFFPYEDWHQYTTGEKQVLVWEG